MHFLKVLTYERISDLKCEYRLKNEKYNIQ